MGASVELEREGAIGTIRFSNPPRHTLTDPMLRALEARLDELARDASLRVLVLTGASDGVFIAHYEVSELAEGAEAAQQAGTASTGVPAGETLHRFNRVTLALERLPAITIAALNGTAMGGGCELSLACDFRLMADGPYRYGLPETGVGIIPGAGGTQRLPRLIGLARALDLILRGHVVTPAEALELGLVHRVLPAAGFREEVGAFARMLAERAPIALAAAKHAARAGLELPLEEGLRVEQQAFARTMRSKDAAGAMRAWLEGKPYRFRGE